MPYLAKLHGSALEYAVKIQPRYLHYAQAGLEGARVVVGGSHYMIDAAAAVVPGWRDRAVVVNPGCDTDLFRPIDRPHGGPSTVGFVGKLIYSKGVQHLLPALPLVTSRPVRAVIVGFGGDEADLARLSDALSRGDPSEAVTIVRASPALADVQAFLEATEESASYWRRARATEVTFTGRLDHDALAPVLPGFDVLAVPSVVPEAFGMVAAEGASCGVLPVVPRHSGVGEVGAAIESAIGMPGLLTYDPADPVRGLAAALDRVLALDPAARDRLGVAVAALARTRWSWDVVAESLLQHASTR